MSAAPPSWCSRPRGCESNYQPLDDTPDKVEAAIRKYQELSSLDKNTEAYRRAYARNLMEQADALLRWGEQDEAERLASRAAGMQVVYGPFEQKPQDLLERIAGMRRQGDGRQMAPPPAAPGYAGASAPPAPSIAARQQAVELVRQAREAIAAGQLDRAECARPSGRTTAAARLGLCTGRGSSGTGAVGPAAVAAARVVGRGARRRTIHRCRPGGNGEPDRTATRAVYDPANDRDAEHDGVEPATGRIGSDLRLAQNPSHGSRSHPPAAAGADADRRRRRRKTPGMALFEQGEAALKAHDATRAYELFRQAAAHINELDPVTAQRLQDHLQLLSVPSRTKPLQAPQAGQAPSLADEAAARQQVLARQVAAELAHKESNARAMRETDPKGALAMLEEARKKVEASGLDSSTRDQLLRRVDRAIGETKQFIEQNRPQIELAEKNKPHPAGGRAGTAS